MRLLDLLDRDNVKVELEAADKEEAIAELIDVLARKNRISDRSGAFDAVMARENQQTTGIGGGVAVPHAKHKSIQKLTAALGVTQPGIEFDAIDGKPVHVVFLILAREDAPGPHIQALAEIARLLQIPGFYRKLVESKSPDELLSVIAAEE